MALTFEPITEHSFEALWAIESYAHRYPWSPSLLRSCLTQPYWGECLLDKQQPLGFYLFQQVLDEVTLMNICIKSEYQGQGFGKQLLKRALNQAQQAKAVQCFLEVRASNQAAICLYQQLGFNQDGRRAEYYPIHDGREDAILMSYAIPHS